ncbi:MAG: hypothetical protein ABJC74_06780, partial [Gemmatimonadota bacterium]
MATPISLGFVRRVAFLIVAFLIGAAAARTPLQAQHTNCVSCPNINISPDGGTATHADNGHYSAVFKAKNGGTGTGTWTIAPNLTGGMTVDSIAPDLEDGLILSTGDSAFITVYYFLATNPGTITLTASGTTNGETGSITVTPNYSVAVTPDSGTRTRLGLSTGLVDTFTVKNAGANSDTYNLTCPVTGQVLTCTLNVPSLALASGASGKAIATYSTGVTGSGTLKVHAVAVTGGESDDGTYYLTVTGTGAPALSSKPQNANYRRLSQCLAACFDVVYQYSTPSYVSLNTARSASLVYNSSTAKPTPVISLNADTGGAATIRPSSYKMEVRLVSTGALLTLLNGSTAVYYNASSNGPTRLTAVLDAQANSLPTGAYAVNVTITAAYTGASYASVSATRFLVDDESHSALGVGVGLAGFQRLYPVSGTNSVVITEGDGSIIYFARSSPTAAFLTPGGSSDSLSYNSGTSTYRRTSLDGGYIEFNASGRMTKSVDRYGNTLLTVGYLGAPLDSVPKTFTDFKSKVIQLCFSANCLGTGKLQKIMVLNSGAGVRNVTTTVDGSGRLIKIVDPDGLSDSLGYNGSGLLTTAWNRAHSATDFKYDAINRIDSSQAPSISLYSGSSGRPTVTLVAADRLGWQPTVAGTSLGTAKAALLPDSVLATITDPLGNATRIALDGFGAPLRITDPYGAVTTIARDTASRVTRTRQPNGHIVGYSYSGFLPTMVYDSTTSQSTLFQYTPAHNIRTLSGSAPRQDFLYRLGTDGAPVGALKKVYIGASANNDTTVTGGKLLETHKVDGLGRDSSIVDAQSHGTHTSFEATWGNTSAIRDSLGNVTAFHYDSVGRNDSILAPHGLASATQFGSMNQVVQSKDPLGHVTLFKYDSLFNLIRVQDPNGWVNKYDYNAAGVLVVRHSPADTTKSDSSWIDLAGNVRRAHTLKGDSLAMSYDKVGRLLIRLAKVDSIHVVADTFRYDTTQMLWRVAANANAYDSLAVDVRGRLVKSLEKLHGQSYTTTYTYDAVDRLIARSLSKTGSSSYTSAMNYVFGATGTLDSLCANAKCVTMHYTSNFLVDTVTYNRGSLAKWTLTQQFDGANAVDSQTYSDTLLRGFNLKVVRDSLEREKWRTSPTVGYAKRKFSYDLDGRLLSATDSGTTVNSVPTYTYDAGDNRRYDSTGSTVTITAGNRLSWDLNGGTYT